MPYLRRYSPTKLCDGAQMAIFGVFLRRVFSASRVQHISDLHPKFTLRPHHVWKYGRDPVCDGWDQARKKETKVEETTRQKYNVRICYAVRRAAIIWVWPSCERADADAGACDWLVLTHSSTVTCPSSSPSAVSCRLRHSSTNSSRHCVHCSLFSCHPLLLQMYCNYNTHFNTL